MRRTVLAVGGLLLSGAVGFGLGKSSQEDVIAAARDETQTAKDETEIALALSQAGFNNVISLETQGSRSWLAKLRLDRNDPQSCALSFIVEKPTDPNLANSDLQLVMPRIDAAGNQYGEEVTRSPEETLALMTEECK